ncbi:MAG: hypothetical protein ABF289_06030 [Clostridiales bacterium]
MEQSDFVIYFRQSSDISYDRIIKNKRYLELWDVIERAKVNSNITSQNIGNNSDGNIQTNTTGNNSPVYNNCNIHNGGSL